MAALAPADPRGAATCPTEGIRPQRQRLEVARKRLGDRYTWEEIEEAENRAERRKLEVLLAELALPADDNIVAFDRAAATLLPFADITSGTSADHQRAIISHIVERVTITDGTVTEILVWPEARPFFYDYRGGEGVWRWRPRTDSNRRRAP